VWKFKIQKGIPLHGFSLNRSFIYTKRDLTYISKVSRMHAKRLIHSHLCGALRGGGHTHSNAHKNIQTHTCTHIYTRAHAHTLTHTRIDIQEYKCARCPIYTCWNPTHTHTHAHTYTQNNSSSSVRVYVRECNISELCLCVCRVVCERVRPVHLLPDTHLLKFCILSEILHSRTYTRTRTLLDELFCVSVCACVCVWVCATSASAAWYTFAEILHSFE